MPGMVVSLNVDERDFRLTTDRNGEFGIEERSGSYSHVTRLEKESYANPPSGIGHQVCSPTHPRSLIDITRIRLIRSASMCGNGMGILVAVAFHCRWRRCFNGMADLEPLTCSGGVAAQTLLRTLTFRLSELPLPRTQS